MWLSLRFPFTIDAKRVKAQFWLRGLEATHGLLKTFSKKPSQKSQSDFFPLSLGWSSGANAL